MNDYVVKVENLGKKYRIGAQQERYKTLREILVTNTKRFFIRHDQQPSNNNTIWALKDVSSEVKQGEVMGIIGRNGAGKSTLLKILAHITEPTEGRVRLRGRVGSLLEVGTGFHSELTGRENIYLNGAILGMSRIEINRKFDEIVAFSEIEKFLDTPVKRYSSGMYVRLAFAVAAHLEPEILVVDEVLAVGDVAFQKKCLGKMGDVARQGRTILFVSHNMAAVRNLCTQTILLEGGRLVTQGTTDQTIGRYLATSEAEMTSTIVLPTGVPDAPGIATRLRLFSQDGTPQSLFRLDETWRMVLDFTLFRSMPHVIAAVGLINADSVSLITYWSKAKDLGAGKYQVEFSCNLPLKACDLNFAIGLSSQERAFYYVHGVGHVAISQIALEGQPFRAEGSGLLLSSQTSEITQSGY